MCYQKAGGSINENYIKFWDKGTKAIVALGTLWIVVCISAEIAGRFW